MSVFFLFLNLSWYLCRLGSKTAEPARTSISLPIVTFDYLKTLEKIDRRVLSHKKTTNFSMVNIFVAAACWCIKKTRFKYTRRKQDILFFKNSNELLENIKWSRFTFRRILVFFCLPSISLDGLSSFHSIRFLIEFMKDLAFHFIEFFFTLLNFILSKIF